MSLALALTIHNKQQWFRQIIPTGCQLLNLFEELKKACIEDNKDNPNYDSDLQDDSFDGRLTWSPKGVHLPPTGDWDCQLERFRFEDGDFITSLTPAIQSVALNAFTHAAGLEVGNFFDDSAPVVNAEMWEYTGEPSHFNLQKIPPVLSGNEIGKVARIRRVTDSR